MRKTVFVFGSNTAGRHGKGAAKAAMAWGARYGQGEGLAGMTYAIPTKDGSLRTLSLDIIEMHVQSFLEFARTRPDLTFELTPIGCGLAGYKPADIAPMFADVPRNVLKPREFL